MLTLHELGAVPNPKGRHYPMVVTCDTKEAAVRILIALISPEYTVSNDIRLRSLKAVIQWIEQESKYQEELRAGMARILLDAAAKVGSTLTNKQE